MYILGDLGRDRQNNFDFIRFIAAVMVIFAHSFALLRQSDFLGSFTGFADCGVVAVDTFFVISGYLITKSMLSRKSLMDYAAARILRIYPGLIVAILLCALVIGPLVGTLPLSEYFYSPDLYVFMVKNMTLWWGTHEALPGVFATNADHGAVGSIWTLPSELKMYVAIFVFGLAGIAIRKQERLVTVLKVMISITVLVYLANKLMHPEHAEDARLDRLSSYFFLGTWTYLFRDKFRLHPAIALGLWAVTLALHQHNVFVPLFRVALAYTVFLLAFHPAVKLHHFGKQGDFSYGLYIYAFPVQQLLIWAYPAFKPVPLFFAALVLTLPVAFLSWHWIEKPAIGLKGKLVLKGKITSEPVPQRQ